MEDSAVMNDLRKRHPAIYEAAHKWVFKPPGTKKRFDWLSTTDIDAVMEQYERYFAKLNFVYLGCVPSDHFQLHPFPMAEVRRADRSAIVFNLDSSNQPGSHWVALYMHWDGDDEPLPEGTESVKLLERSGIVGGSARELRQSYDRWALQQTAGSDQDPNLKAIASCYGQVQTMIGGGPHRRRHPLTLDYFDSTGSKPNQNILRTIDYIRERNPGCVARRNTIEHQKLDTECGVYSMYFILQRLQGRSFQEINRQRITDASMNQYRDDLFRPRVTVYQKDFDAVR
jgi:hypothetical protein